jgi:SEC-C motif domain protein|tara:strand:- start:238 stop:624 length:387 start_codon:yes stop_codon:yes gene_type:complete
LHHGEPASSPEALMRSRYSAFVRDNADYMRASWHPDTRPAELTLEGGDQWLGLEIVDAKQEGDAGQVHFRATHRDGDGFAVLEEHSRFVRENDHWFYLDGEHTVTPLKPGRNNPCPCGSGRKFKKCCG